MNANTQKTEQLNASATARIVAVGVKDPKAPRAPARFGYRVQIRAGRTARVGKGAWAEIGPLHPTPEAAWAAAGAVTGPRQSAPPAEAQARAMEGRAD